MCLAARVSECAPEKPKRSALNQLTRTLLRRYDCGVRPVHDWTSVTTVYVDLILLSVLDVVTPLAAESLTQASAVVLLTDSTFVLTGWKDSEHHHQHLVQTGRTDAEPQITSTQVGSDFHNPTKLNTEVKSSFFPVFPLSGVDRRVPGLGPRRV